MKTIRNLTLFIPFVSLFLITSSCSKEELKPWEKQIETLRESMKDHTDFETATAMGYVIDATGYRAGMGHHFLNPELVDDKFELYKPEVMLFAPDKNGKMQFVAVEYGIAIEDLENPPQAPEGFTGNVDEWEISEEFSLWTLHVWIGMDNERGIFSPRNPSLP